MSHKIDPPDGRANGEANSKASGPTDSDINGLTFYNPHHTSDEDATRDIRVNRADLNSEDNITDGYLEHFSDPDTSQESDDDDAHELELPDPAWLHQNASNHRSSLKRCKLIDKDIELLRLVVAAADRKVRQSERSGRGSPFSKGDFADLFQVFKSFTARNSLAPDNYPTYYQCMNAIVHLCTYEDEPTWTARFETLLKDHSIQEARRVHQRLLHDNLVVYELERMRHHFRNWRGLYTTRAMYDQNVMAVAVTHDKTLLKRDSFKHWRTHLANNRWRLTSAETNYEHALQFRTLKKLYQKLSLIRDDIYLSQEFVAVNILHKWQQAAADVQKAGARANKIYEQNITSRVLRDWAQALREKWVQQNFDSRLAQSVLQGWHRAAMHARTMESVAVEKDYELTRRSYLRRWVGARQLRLQDLEVADVQCADLQERRTLAYWRKQLNLNNRQLPAGSLSSGILAQRVLREWSLRALRIKEADNFRRFMLLRQCVVSWRLGTGYELMTQRINSRIAWEVFRTWQLEQRLVLFQRHQERRDLEGVISRWNRKTRKAHRRERAFASEAAEYHECTLKMLALTALFKRLQVMDADEAMALKFRNESLLKNHFHIMKERALYIEKLFIAAQTLHEENTLRKHLLRLRVEARRQKALRLQKSLRMYQLRKEEERKRLAFGTWMEHHDVVIGARRDADSLWLAHTRSRCRGILRSMNSFRTAMDAARDRAAFLDSESTQSAVLSRWVERFRAVAAAQEEASFLADIKALQHQERMFRSWRMKAFKIVSRTREANELYNRLQGSRLRKTWILWRAKTKDENMRFHAAGNHAHTVGHATTKVAPWTTDSLIETPTRVRSKKLVSVTSVDRWRRMKENSTLDRSPIKRRTRLAEILDES